MAAVPPRHALCAAWFALSGAATAALYDLPLPGSDVVGEAYEVRAEAQDTLLDIAREHGIGQQAIVNANPGVDRWLPGAGTRITIPARHVLPDAPRDGLVLNLPEMRLYRYREAAGVGLVVTYPVSVGRMDWRTPLGRTEVVGKQHKPTWFPPASLRQEALAAGEPPLPDAVPPGPDNPLGDYALRLGLPGYLLHGTNKPWGVGMRVTHGCIRLLPEHVAELFEQVPVGTPVHIVNQPVKVGWYGNTLFLEVHPPLEEDALGDAALLRRALDLIYAALAEHPARLDGSAVRQAVAGRSGLPVAVAEGPGVGLDNPLFRN